MSFSKTQVLKGEDPKEKIKNIKLDLAQRIKIDDADLTELLKIVVIELKLISLKLNCLQPDELDENDLEEV